jgi:hypothetical protein
MRSRGDRYLRKRADSEMAGVGRVEVWRGDVRLSMSVSAPFVWRCLSGSAVDPFSSVWWADVRQTADITNVTRFPLSEILP